MNCLIPATEELGGLYIGNLDSAMSVGIKKIS